jgi:hypothetical protein
MSSFQVLYCFYVELALLIAVLCLCFVTRELLWNINLLCQFVKYTHQLTSTNSSEIFMREHFETIEKSLLLNNSYSAEKIQLYNVGSPIYQIMLQFLLICDILRLYFFHNTDTYFFHMWNVLNALVVCMMASDQSLWKVVDPPHDIQHFSTGYAHAGTHHWLVW